MERKYLDVSWAVSDELQGFDGVDDGPTYGLSDECDDFEVWYLI